MQTITTAQTMSLADGNQLQQIMIESVSAAERLQGVAKNVPTPKMWLITQYRLKMWGWNFNTHAVTQLRILDNSAD